MPEGGFPISPLRPSPPAPTDPVDRHEAKEKEPPPHRHLSRSVAAGLLVIVVVATVQAALAGSPTPRRLGFDERRYELWSNNLYSNGFFGDKANSPLAKEELRSVPFRAYLAPGYPFVLVALKEIHADNSVVRRGLQAAMVGLVVLLVGLISFRLFGPIAALLSGGMLIATGVLATYAQLTLSEVLFTAIFVGSVALTFVGLQRRSWRLLVAAGLLLGYAILVRPQVLLLPVPIALYIFFASGRRRTAALMAGVYLAASFGVVVPWTIRNELRLHAFVPVATYTWLNFWEVNNPKANGHFILPQRTMPAESRRIGALPEIEQDLAWKKLALTWVRAHPAAAMKGWVRDAGLFFSYKDPYVREWYALHGWRPPRLDERLLYPLVLAAGILVLVYRRRWKGIWLLVIVTAYFDAFFAFFLPLPRYRMPLLPILVILAAGVPEMVWGVISSRRARVTGDLPEQHAPTSAPAGPIL
jgi:hypothetical protein